MSRIDETKPFLPVNIAILTVSDTRHETDDKSGRTLADLAARDGHRVVARTIVKAHDGQIDVENRNGAVFRIKLPLNGRNGGASAVAGSVGQSGADSGK